MKIINSIAFLFLVFTTVFTACNNDDTGKTIVAASTFKADNSIDRSSLPIREPGRQTYKELDVRNAKAPARFEVKAPKGAPNVVVVLLDDIGFGASAAFGGPIN